MHHATSHICESRINPEPLPAVFGIHACFAGCTLLCSTVTVAHRTGHRVSSRAPGPCDTMLGP
jgi:hypothetical protein